MTRKTITIREEVFDTLDAHKGDNESWSGFLERLLEAAISDDEHMNTLPNSGGIPSEAALELLEDLHENALTVDHLDDIASETSRQTANEVENRLTGR